MSDLLKKRIDCRERQAMKKSERGMHMRELLLAMGVLVFSAMNVFSLEAANVSEEPVVSGVAPGQALISLFCRFRRHPNTSLCVKYGTVERSRPVASSLSTSGS